MIKDLPRVDVSGDADRGRVSVLLLGEVLHKLRPSLDQALQMDLDVDDPDVSGLKEEFANKVRKRSTGLDVAR